MKNPIILQGFEWYLPEDQQHWLYLKNHVAQFQRAGITAIWLPPAYKGEKGAHDVGYGPYDLYDLGEFQQKGSIATKYGTKEDYLACITALKKAGIDVYADIVFDHFMGADESEDVLAQEVQTDQRDVAVGAPRMIEAWTKFTFPARNKQYNSYEWHWRNFSGIDYDDREDRTAVFKFADKKWAQEIDTEKGNFDYLMGCNLDMSEPETVAQLDAWGRWYQILTDIDGYRLDAVKHIEFSFFNTWLTQRQKEKGQPLFVVGEYWSGHLPDLRAYLAVANPPVQLFDVPLHFRLHDAARLKEKYDLRTLFTNTLVEESPARAVTFVDNHDTQKGQSLESHVAEWFKVHAYAAILLRNGGTPVVFWTDLVGNEARQVQPVGEALTRLMHLRRQIAFGMETNYFDDAHVIAWSYQQPEAQETACVVILNNEGATQKKLQLNDNRAGQKFVAILTTDEPVTVTIGANGWGMFPVTEKGVQVYVDERTATRFFASLPQK